MTLPTTAPVLQVTGWTETALLQILGFGLLALVAATGVAFVFRQRTTREIPAGAGVLLGVSVVAVWLNLDAVLTGSVVADTALRHYGSGVFLLGTFVVGTLVAELGRRIGDHLACDVFGIANFEARGDVVGLLRAARLAVVLEVPTEIEDAEGYLPVGERVERALAGRRLLFPRRLSVEELSERFATRLRRDFDVDHVDATFSEEGEIERLALGRKASGLGASLPPGTVGVALRGSPLPEAGTGDPVEVWTDGDAAEFVTTGELRATNGDVTTVVVDEDDVDELSHERTYRLVTHPDTTDDLSELVPVIRKAEETMTTVTVEPDGPLDGEFAGWLPVRVPVIDRDGTPIPFPAERETLQAGDRAYVVGTPAALRQLDDYERDREQSRTDEESPAPSERHSPVESE